MLHGRFRLPSVRCTLCFLVDYEVRFAFRDSARSGSYTPVWSGLRKLDGLIELYARGVKWARYSSGLR